MEKTLFRSLTKLLVLSALLFLLVIRFDDVRGMLSNIIYLFSPLYLGLALAFVLSGPCNFFQRKLDGMIKQDKWKSLSLPTAVTLSYLLMILVLVALFSFVIPQIAQNVEIFASNLEGYVLTIQAFLNRIFTSLDLETLNFSQMNNVVNSLINGAVAAVSTAFPQIISMTGTFFSFLVSGLLSLVFSVYMLAGKDTLLSQTRRALKAYLSPKWFQKVMDVIDLTIVTFRRFIVGQILDACILGLLISLGCGILRFPYAPLIGTLVGVTALVPIVGAYVGAITSALLVAMESPVQAMWFLVMLVCVQQFEGNVIYPRLVGSSLGLPGIWVLGAVTIGGGIFGFTGMVLGVPVAAVLYTLFRNDVHKRLGTEEMLQ